MEQASDFPIPDWPNIDKAAEMLGVSDRQVKYLIQDNKLASMLRPMPGRRPERIVNPEDIRRYQEEKNAVSLVVLPKEREVPHQEAVRKRETINIPVPNSLSDLEAFAKMIGRELAAALAAPKESYELLTPDEACAYAKMSESLLRKLRKDGRLTNAGTPGKVMYRKREIDNL